MDTAATTVGRISAMILVVILAAVLGLLAGSALDARADGGPAGAIPNPRFQLIEARASTGAPSYADPYRAYLDAAEQHAASDGATLTAPEPR